MKSKYFFEDKKDQIKEEHKLFKTKLESTDITNERCDHKGKCNIVNGILRCKCGSAWSGPGLDTLFDLFSKK
jgi:hypothetical protein